MPDIESRLTRLETAARRWRAVAVCAVLLVPLLGLDKLTPEEIRAHRFVVVNDEGVEIATLGTEDGGATGLVLRNPDRTVACMLGAHPDGALLQLVDNIHDRSALFSANRLCVAVTLFEKASDTQISYGPGPGGTLVWGHYSGGSPKSWLGAQ